MWTELLDRVIPGRAAGRAARTFRKFDEGCGYERYHATCRALSKRPGGNQATPIATLGLEHLRVLSAEHASQLRKAIEARFSRGDYKGYDYLEAFSIHDDAFRDELLRALLSPAVDERVARFFESEYLVHWFSVTCAKPIEQPPAGSYLWHCDKGPSRHLKLLTYLNGVEEHGGGTEFLDLATTRALDRTGYVFGKVAKRREDLAPLARRQGIALLPHAWPMAAGEGILFQPSGVLHRGRLPTRGPRYVATICLLPSPVPWREALAKGTLSTVGEDEKWHADASSLLRALAPAA